MSGKLEKLNLTHITIILAATMLAGAIGIAASGVAEYSGTGQMASSTSASYSPSVASSVISSGSSVASSVSGTTGTSAVAISFGPASAVSHSVSASASK